MYVNKIMPKIDDEFKQLEEAYRHFLIAYTILKEKKTKNKAPEARKALMDIINISKDMRKSIQEFKESI